MSNDESLDLCMIDTKRKQCVVTFGFEEDAHVYIAKNAFFIYFYIFWWEM